MKDRKEQIPMMEQPMDAIPVETIEAPKSFVVNCHKCGAALNLKSGKTAYICPVCNTLLRMRVGTRIVKEIPVKEKYIHLTLTQSAAKHILYADRDYRVNEAKEKASPLYSEEKATQEKKKVQSALESLIAQHISVNKYEEGDVLVIDANGDELSVTTSKRPL